MTQQPTTRLPSYWTHLDGSPCINADSARYDGVGGEGPSICDDHDRRVYPPTGESTGSPTPGKAAATWREVVRSAQRGEVLNVVDPKA